MSEQGQFVLILRSVGAVLAGMVFVVVLSIVTDVALEKFGLLPPADQPLLDARLLGLATGYRTLYAIIGAWLAARLAPTRPMGHALATGIIGLVLNIVGAVVARDLGPSWYPLLLTALALPSAWAGGYLSIRRDRR